MELAGTDQWMVQMNERLKSHESSSMEIEKWKTRCIYAIRSSVSDLNKRAYNPQTVSFGPYHHMKKQVVAMEEHKHRALFYFLRRCGKPLEVLMKTMAEVKEDLKDCYKPLDDQWENNDHSFLKMLILDGCFMLEMLRLADCDDNNGSDYAENDPIFSCHGRLYIIPYIKRDMLMLENQIPMMVLEKLIEFEGNKNQDIPELLNKLILKFFCRPSTDLILKSKNNFLHILDLYRKSLLPNEPTHPTVVYKQTKSKDHEEDEIIIPSARELQDAGIKFKPSKTDSLKDVSFIGEILRIPPIIVDDCTETMMLNLIAFERMHVGAGNEISAFIFFMDNIIDNEIDVVILERKGIIQNALGSDKTVAKLFNSLSRDISVDHEGVLDILQVSVRRYCKNPWNRWRANLIETYFRNPWAIVSLAAAIFLFVLTIVQTTFSILQVTNSKCPSPPPRPCH